MTDQKVGVRIPSSAPCDVSGHRHSSEPSFGFGASCLGPGGGRGGLLGLDGVEGEFAQGFAGGCVDHGHLKVLDQEQEFGRGI